MGLLAGFSPQIVNTTNTFARVVKTADQIISNSDTQINDTELKVTLNINKTYGFIFFFWINSSTVADIQWQFAIPTGSSGFRSDQAISATATPTQGLTVFQSTPCDGNNQVIGGYGRIIMGSTAGDLQLTWAQNTPEVSDTKILEGSSLIVWEEL